MESNDSIVLDSEPISSSVRKNIQLFRTSLLISEIVGNLIVSLELDLPSSKMHSSLKTILFLWSAFACAKSADDVDLLKYTHEFMDMANRYLSEFADVNQDISWSNEINGVNKNNLKLDMKLSADLKAYIKDLNEVLVNTDVNIIEDRNLRRQLKKIPGLGYYILEAGELAELSNATLEMTEIYKTVNLCSYQHRNVCNLTLIPHVQDIIHMSNDIKEIEYYWLEWRVKTGSSIRDKFQKFVELYRKTALLNGK